AQVSACWNARPPSPTVYLARQRMRSPPPFEVVIVPSPDQVPARGANGPACAKAGADAGVNPATTSTQPSGLTEKHCMRSFPSLPAIEPPRRRPATSRAAEFTDAARAAQGRRESLRGDLPGVGVRLGLRLEPQLGHLLVVARGVAENLFLAGEILRRAVDAVGAVPRRRLHGERRIDEMRARQRHEVGATRRHDGVDLI